MSVGMRPKAHRRLLLSLWALRNAGGTAAQITWLRSVKVIAVCYGMLGFHRPGPLEPLVLRRGHRIVRVPFFGHRPVKGLSEQLCRVFPRGLWVSSIPAVCRLSLRNTYPPERADTF